MRNAVEIAGVLLLAEATVVEVDDKPTAAQAPYQEE